MGAWVPQAPGVYSVNTARTAVPGALAAPRLTAHHSGCAEQALPPLQGCCREQQSKTNSQTQQMYFFDSLNIKKGEKKKSQQMFNKAKCSPHCTQDGDSVSRWRGLGSPGPSRPGCAVVPWQAWVPGGLTPGPCPSQRGVGLWPDQGPGRALLAGFWQAEEETGREARRWYVGWDVGTCWAEPHSAQGSQNQGCPTPDFSLLQLRGSRGWAGGQGSSGFQDGS